MSGETHTTVVTPSPEELAAQAAAGVRADAMATARRAVQALDGLADVVPGTMRRAGRDVATVTLRVATSRVDLEVHTSEGGRVGYRARVHHTPGVSCAQEARLVADVFERIAKGGPAQPLRPPAGAAAPRTRLDVRRAGGGR